VLRLTGDISVGFLLFDPLNHSEDEDQLYSFKMQQVINDDNGLTSVTLISPPAQTKRKQTKEKKKLNRRFKITTKTTKTLRKSL